MATSKKYFHDHLVLLLLSTNAFLAAAGSIFVLVSLSSGHGNNGVIVQCRDCSNASVIDRFKTGGVIDLLGFVAFMLIVLVVNVTVSLRAYQIHRQLAVAILGMGVLLLVLAIVISNALLVLR